MLDYNAKVSGFPLSVSGGWQAFAQGIDLTFNFKTSLWGTVEWNRTL